jgi:phosphoribosylamine-glycine ligase
MVSGFVIATPWQNFSKIEESKNFFLLYLRKNQIQALQKRMFRDEQEIRDFRDFVKSKLG